MAAKEFNSEQEAGNEESTPLQVDPYEEEEETLSLCDLPIYSGSVSGRWSGDLSKNFGDGEDDNMFEFFSEEFTASSNDATAENIIFCGKLIPFKDINPPRSVQKGGDVLAWRAVNKAKAPLKKGELMEVRKGRWFLFMFGFGMSKLPNTVMELRDIRKRQSRRREAEEDEKKEGVKGKRSCKGMWKLLKSISLVLGCNSSKIAKDVVLCEF